MLKAHNEKYGLCVRQMDVNRKELERVSKETARNQKHCNRNKEYL